MFWKGAPMAPKIQCLQCPKKLNGKTTYMKHVFQEHLANLEKNSEKNVKISCSEYAGLSCDFSVMTSDLDIFKEHFDRNQ